MHTTSDLHIPDFNGENVCPFSEQSTSAAPTTSTVSTTVEQVPVEGEHLILGENSPGYTAEGEIISTQTVSSKTRTVETITVS